MRGHRSRPWPSTRCVWTLLAVLVTSGLPAHAEGPTVELVARNLGFDDADRQRLEKGEIVSAEIGEGTEKELALAVAMLVKRPMHELYEGIRGGKLLEASRVLLHAERIEEGEVGPEAFAALDLGASELAKLAEVEPGMTFNLSQAEIEALGKQKASGPEAVAQAYRAVLAARLEAYRQGGVGAIAPYARGGDERSSPSDDLAEAIRQQGRLEEHAPTFYRAFARYPGEAAEGVEHQFFWLLETVQDRPTAVLSHRAFELHEAYALMAERQFFVGQSFNGLQIIAGAFARGDETIVFYTNRTFTDQVAGFGGGAKRKIGRRMMLGEIEDLFASIRKQLETSRLVPPRRVATASEAGVSGPTSLRASQPADGCVTACREAHERCVTACGEHENPIECDAACRDREQDCLRACR